jgi:hypothetical protein
MADVCAADGEAALDRILATDTADGVIGGSEARRLALSRRRGRGLRVLPRHIRRWLHEQPIAVQRLQVGVGRPKRLGARSDGTGRGRTPARPPSRTCLDGERSSMARSPATITFESSSRTALGVAVHSSCRSALPVVGECSRRRWRCSRAAGLRGASLRSRATARTLSHPPPGPRRTSSSAGTSN